MRRRTTCSSAYGDRTPEWLDAHPTRAKVAGRMMFKRVMGKASFAKLKDRSGLIQIFLQQEALAQSYDEFKGWDVGDIVGAEGTLFKTKTGELSVHVENACGCSSSRCGRCRTSGTAWPTSRAAIVSATST